MKAILVVLAVFASQAFANELLECFGPILDNISTDRQDLQDWAADVRATAERLQAQRQRCNDIPRDDPPTALQDRLIQACNAAWSASFAYELSRLFGGLNTLDPELAAELRRQAGSCFTDVPETPAFLTRVLESVF